MERRHFFRTSAAAALAGAAPSALAAAGGRADDPARAGNRHWLIHGAYVLSMDPAIGDLPRADVYVRDGRIEAVGRNLPRPAGVALIDGDGAIVCPGFVNGHIHLAQSMQRGLSTEHTFVDYFQNIVLKYSNRMTPDDVRLAEYVGALEQIAVGTTTLMDWNRESMTPDHAEAAIDGLQSARVRAVFAYTVAARTRDGSDAPIRRMLAHAGALRKGRLASDAGLVQLGACLPGPDFMPLDPALADLRLLRELDVLTSFHCGAPIYAQRKPRVIAQLAERGMLGGRLQLVHANDLADDEYKIAADHGLVASATPEAELHCGHGHPAIWKAAAAGLPMSLGTDIPSALGGGMMMQMRIALGAEVARRNAVAFRETGKAPPTKGVSARDMLALATVDGAAAIGLGKVTGSLTPGKRADLLVVRVDDAAVAPMLDAAGTLVMQATPAQIDSVMVDGRLLKSGGRLLDPGADQAMRALRARALAMMSQAAGA